MSGEQDNNIDAIEVIIVMDSTGSMQSWINSAKNTVLDAFSDIKKQYTESTIRLGLVCYRDIGDDERFVVSPLTENIEAIQQVLRDTRATGGNDTAEDVAGALEKVLELFREGFSREYNPVRTVLFVTDAPAHGLRYHPITLGDRFPNGDPEGKEPYDQVREMANMGVDLTIFRINSTVDQMIEEFHKAFKETQATLTVLDVREQDISYSSTIASMSLTNISSSSLLNGFIDLSTYDSDDYKYESERTFKDATCKSILSSILRRKV